MAKTESAFKHSNLSFMLRDHKKKMLSSRDKLLLGCDAEANAGAEVAASDLSELEERDIWEDHELLGAFDLDDHSIMDAFPAKRSGLATLGSNSSANPSHSHNRMIPQSEFHARSKLLLRQQSAPMNVPDWSKILGTSGSKSSSNLSDELGDDNDDSDVDDDRDRRRLPPHEVAARDHARGHSVAFSLYEGAGHTLKGRDLSRVRNAVLKQTGFL